MLYFAVLFLLCWTAGREWAKGERIFSGILLIIALLVGLEKLGAFS